MEESQTWNLMAKKLAGEATPQELRLLETLMQRDGQESLQEKILQKIWDTPAQTGPQAGFDETWQKIASDISDTIDLGSVSMTTEQIPPVQQLHARKWLMAAAVLLVMLSGSFLFYYLNESPVKENIHLVKNEVITKNGSRTEMTLPDGSVVIMNSGSSIEYDKEFGVSNRALVMNGEAFFDVKHNSDVPFVITTKAGTIKVLGTAFNVRAYSDEQVFETSLLRGSVELSLKKQPGRHIILKPMQKLSVQLPLTDSEQIAPGGTSSNFAITRITPLPADSFAVEEVSWIKHRYIFREEKFEQLSKKIEKWYGVSIVFDDPALKERVFTGVFDDLNIEEALKALVFSSGNSFTYSITNNQVRIMN